MVFLTEAEFEKALVDVLKTKGWEEVLDRPSREELLENWKQILLNNNQQRDRLNNVPLTDSEMQQVLEQIAALRTPLKLNGFINGKTVSIKRDNPADPEHLGKEVSLHIYDRNEIAGGRSRYQIAVQPQLPGNSTILGGNRGDLMLLINGMPVIHIELKRSGVPVGQATAQIERYAKQGVYGDVYSLVQVFVAATPDETVYFANPGPEGVFNPDFYFHWADFNNEPLNEWRDVASTLLSIPMAHQLIGFYTVADDTDGVLKVMRSYQYFAANAISDKVGKLKPEDWKTGKQRGGYIWHTTGSGKTMTSFKSAQLIASSKDADKVVFLMDRIELGTQSLMEYRGFADATIEVQSTEDTHALIEKLKSNDPRNALIVTSIQKMSLVSVDGGVASVELARLGDQRIVFVVDEAHRSTFGDMLATIKETFPEAIFFGFTGTPIQEENQKKRSTTATIFGDELHRYSIADGIRDRNVLGFDPYMIETYPHRELRKQVALRKADAQSVEEALGDPEKKPVYQRFMNASEVPDAGHIGDDGKYVKGIEDFVPKGQYRKEEHHLAVVRDIVENWAQFSSNSKFHAIFATSSIPEAIEYYRLFKAEAPALKVTALFDPNAPEGDARIAKEDGLVEILEDYNARYGQNFTLASHGKFKKDVAARLAHKKPHLRIEKAPDEQLDLLIVVDQMLTGFDSKWVNTLYLDKVLEYADVIQAFSRTNRLFDPEEKPFGVIRYYRKPRTMRRNIEAAVKLYAGDKPLGLFVEKLDQNLSDINHLFEAISNLFAAAGVPDFARLPDEPSERGEFAKQFAQLSEHLEAARVQGFTWSKSRYEFERDDKVKIIDVELDEDTYLTLALRYKELAQQAEGPDEAGEVTFSIATHLTEIDTGRIDTDYMNSRFEKWLKALEQDEVTSEQRDALLSELHSQFARLTQDEQKHANLFIHDVQTGTAKLAPGKTFRDYISDYMHSETSAKVRALVAALGVNQLKLENLMGCSEAELDAFGRMQDLRSTVDRERAADYFESLDGVRPSSLTVSIRVGQILKDFILTGNLALEYDSSAIGGGTLPETLTLMKSDEAIEPLEELAD